MPIVTESTEFVGSFGELSRELMAGMLDQSEDCVKILGLDGRINFVNSNGRCIMEIDDFAAIAGRAWDVMWPNESVGRVRAAIADAQAGTATRFEAFCPTVKGTPKWWEVTVTPVKKADGQPFAIMAVSRDVSERRKAAESIEAMAQEMLHRLRNAFAVSAAITQSSGRDEPQHRSFAQTLAQRFGILSLVQSKLIEAGQTHTLDAMVNEIAVAFDPGGKLIVVGPLPSLELDEGQVRFISLVLGELSTNSIKHGALRAGLRIDITGRVEGGEITLDWIEQLGEAPEEIHVVGQSGGGSGHGLMQRMARAHNASLDVRLDEKQLVARLILPTSR